MLRRGYVRASVRAWTRARAGLVRVYTDARRAPERAPGTAGHTKQDDTNPLRAPLPAAMPASIERTWRPRSVASCVPMNAQTTTPTAIAAKWTMPGMSGALPRYRLPLRAAM